MDCLPNVARTSQSRPGRDVEKIRTVRLKPQKSWEPSGEKQSEWAAVSSSWGWERAGNRPSKEPQPFSRKESWARTSPRTGRGGPYQVVVGAKGSPELSSEGIPDVNRVLPAAAGHAERDMDTEAPVLSKEGEEAN